MEPYRTPTFEARSRKKKNLERHGLGGREGARRKQCSESQ